jgi:translation initiation factor 1
MGRDPETRLVYSTGGEPTRDTGGAPPVSDGRRIRLHLDRRASGRVVTVVTGLPGSAAQIDALGRQLKTACGTGGTVKDGTLELQGNHRERVEAALSALGLRSKRVGG